MKFSYLVQPEVVHYIRHHTLHEHPAQAQLRAATEQQVPQVSVMLSSPEQMALMQLLLRLTGAKRVLEIGVFTGYSALSFALAIPDDGQVIACDVSKEFTDIGKPFWNAAQVANKIDLRLQPALLTLQELLQAGQAGTFDFAFIDADKTNYDQYYEYCLQLVKPNGLIAIDNVLWSGRVLDSNANDEYTVALRNLNAKIKQDKRVDAAMASIADGVFFVRKL